MIGENILMIEMSQLQEFMPFISGALGGATSVGLFKGPIQTLQDWWYINYGHDTSTTAALLQATREANVEKLKNDILSEVVRIPPENIQEPKVKILGPALEASRYYIEEEELRKMFARIIANSLDKSKSEKIHSSFIEIIKQLDVLDAKILQFLKRNQVDVQAFMPTMYMYSETTDGRQSIFPLIFLTPDFSDFHKNAVSLINLERLGLISLRTDIWLSDDTSYNYIRKHHTITHILEQHPEFILDKSCLGVTDYGQNFIDSCVV